MFDFRPLVLMGVRAHGGHIDSGVRCAQPLVFASTEEEHLRQHLSILRYAPESWWAIHSQKTENPGLLNQGFGVRQEYHRPYRKFEMNRPCNNERWYVSSSLIAINRQP